MSVREMRAAISKAYESATWRDKVKTMPDNQVIAIYYSMLTGKRLDRNRPKHNPNQISMDDILKGRV